MPKSAYIHIPFCSHKCDFCDFAVVVNMEPKITDYCRTVSKEIRARLKKNTSNALKTVFYGGGTPGYIEPADLNIIQQTLIETISIQPTAEVTLETTPKTITAEKLDAWLKMGINRISIGIESFQNEELSAMGRGQSKQDALAGVQAARQAGFQNIAVDLMYGLPEQTLSSWQDTLDELLALKLPHLSAYALTLAVNSPLLKRYPADSKQMPNEDLAATMYEELVEKTAAAGLKQYEVSNFAKVGFESQHNLTYWKNEEYYGFGQSAHRYVDGIRSHNWRSFSRYMEDFLGAEEEEIIDQSTRVKEAIILGLRTTAGINLEKFAGQYGFLLEERYAPAIKDFLDQKLLVQENGHLKLTRRGMLLSNLVLAEFV